MVVVRINWDKVCKVPVHARHSIKINKFKSIGCYYIPQTLLYMNYGEYKNVWDEMVYNFKELSTFVERLKHA